MSFVNATEQERRLQAARMEQAKKACVQAVFERFPLLLRAEANSRMILEIVAKFAGEDGSPNWEVTPTLELFLTAVELNPSEMSSLVQRKEDVHRAQAIEDILALLKAKGKGYQDDFVLDMEKRRLSTMSLQDLRTRLASIKESHRMAAIPVSQHRADLAAQAAAQRPSEFQPMPFREVRASGELVELDAASIRRMPASDIQKLLKRFGSEQVNSRLAGR